MSANYFQLSLDLDKWTGNVNPIYTMNKPLKEIWEDSPQPDVYDPYGIDDLLDQLQLRSYFSRNPNIRTLDSDSFKRGGIERISHLLNLLNTTDTSPLIKDMYKNIHRWLEITSVTREIIGGTTLKELWDSPSTYNSDGVPKLIYIFQNNGDFTTCGEVRNLDTISFTPSSGIKTMGDFHKKLSPCGRAA